MTVVWWDRIIASVLTCGVGYLMYGSLEFPRGGEIFPLFSGSVVLFGVLVSLILGFFSKSQERTRVLSWDNARPYLLFILLLVSVGLANRLGFFASMTLFFIGTALFLGFKLRRLHVVLVTTALVLVSIYLLLVLALRVDFPQGVLF